MKTPARAPLTPEAAEPSPPAETRRAAIRDDHSDAPVVEDPFVAFTEWVNRRTRPIALGCKATARMAPDGPALREDP